MIKKTLIILMLLAVIGTAAFFLLKGRKQVPADPWEAWVEAQTRFSITQEVALAKRDGVKPGGGEVAALREKMRTELKANVASLKKVFPDPPEPSRIPYQFHIEANRPKQYDGPWPQTPESLLAAFGEMYNRGHSNGRWGEVDKMFPRAEWLERLLTKGVTIENYSEFSGLLNARWSLYYDAERGPEKWASGKAGIAPAHDWETYQENFIERRIWKTKQISAAQKEDPLITGGAFVGPNQRVFLPLTANRVYVELMGDDTIATTGVLLSEAERINLAYRGIHPEHLEVIYIDNNGSILDEKPPRLSWDLLLEKWGVPPPDWKKQLEGEATPPGFIESANRVWKTDNTRQDYATPTEQRQTAEKPDDALTEDTDFRERAREAAQAEMEKVDQAQQDLLEYATKTDAEIEAELEKILTPDGLSADIENHLREQFGSGQLTPERFEKALDTLEEYGLVEGLRKLKESDPTLALEVQKRLRQEAPSREVEEPSKSSPTPPAFDED